MKCTLLGTSSAIGMPAPLCTCDYCESTTRTRPSLLVETEHVTLLFDISPDIRTQLRGMMPEQLNGIFLTHHHHDHATGLREVNHTTLSKDRVVIDGEITSKTMHSWLGQTYELYCSPEALTELRSDMGYLMNGDGFNANWMDDNDSVTIGDVTVTAFVSEHCLTYIGFLIESPESTVVYHPDFGVLRTTVDFPDVDMLVMDGSSFLGYDIHGTQEQFKRVVESVEPQDMIFTNVSEHIAQEDTETLNQRAERSPGRIVTDGYTF